MVQNRLEAYFASMKQPAETDDDVDAGTEAEPKNAFARNLAARMFFKNKSIDQLAELTGLDPRRIQTLRSSGIKSLLTAKKPDDVHRIAEALECTPEDLFKEDPPPEASTAVDPKAEEMLRVALSGPKKSFILDALQMAYVAALTSKSSYS